MEDIRSTAEIALPDFCTPGQIAEHFGISERRVRSDARRHGCCRVVGKRIFLTRADLDVLLEVWRVRAEPSLRSRIVSPTGPYSKPLRLRHMSETTEAALKLLEKAAGRRSSRKPG